VTGPAVTSVKGLGDSRIWRAEPVNGGVEAAVVAEDIAFQKVEGIPFEQGVRRPAFALDAGEAHG